MNHRLPRLLGRMVGRVDLGAADQDDLARRGVLTTMSVAAQGLLRFVTSVLIGRFLGPAILATTNGAIAVAQIASLLWATASGNAAVKFIALARGRGDQDAAWSVAHFLGRRVLLTSLPAAVLAASVSAAVILPGRPVEAVCAGLLALALSSYNFVRGVYFSAGLVRRVVTWDVITFGIGIGLLVVLIAVGRTELLLLPLALAYGIYALVGWPRRDRRRDLPAVTRAARREMDAFVAWGSLSALATSGFIQLSMVFANTFGTASDAGYYAAALSIATPASLLSSALALTLFPSMAHATGRDDHAAARRQADLATRGLLAVLGAAFGTLGILSGVVVVVLYGPAFDAAVTDLRILLAASLLTTLSAAATSLLLAGGRSAVRLSAMLNTAGVAIGLIVMAILIPSLSVHGVALGYLAGTVVSGFGPVVVVWRRERMPWGSIMLRSSAGAVLVVAVVVASNVFGWPWIADVLAAAAFLVAWALLMSPELRVVASIRKRSAS